MASGPSSSNKWSYTYLPKNEKREDPDPPFQATFMLPSDDEEDESDWHTHEKKVQKESSPFDAFVKGVENMSLETGGEGKKEVPRALESKQGLWTGGEEKKEVPRVLESKGLGEEWEKKWESCKPKKVDPDEPMNWEWRHERDETPFKNPLAPFDDMEYMAEFMYTRPMTPAERKECGIGYATNVDVGGGNSVLVEQMEDPEEFVVCTVAHNPSQFYVVFAEHMDEIEAMQREIRKKFPPEGVKRGKRLKLNNLREGQPLMAFISNPEIEAGERKKEDKGWARCQVIRQDANMIGVRCYDNGHQEEITKAKNVCHMPTWMKHFPAYAIRCRLRFKNETLDDKSKQGRWTSKERNVFRKLVYKQHLSIVVHGRNEYVRYEKVTAEEKKKARGMDEEYPASDGDSTTRLDEYKVIRGDTPGVQDKFTWTVSASVVKPGKISRDSTIAAGLIGLHPEDLETAFIVVVQDLADNFEEQLKHHGLCYPRVRRPRRKSM